MCSQYTQTIIPVVSNRHKIFCHWELATLFFKEAAQYRLWAAPFIGKCSFQTCVSDFWLSIQQHLGLNISWFSSAPLTGCFQPKQAMQTHLQCSCLDLYVCFSPDILFSFHTDVHTNHWFVLWGQLMCLWNLDLCDCHQLWDSWLHSLQQKKRNQTSQTLWHYGKHLEVTLHIYDITKQFIKLDPYSCKHGPLIWVPGPASQHQTVSVEKTKTHTKQVYPTVPFYRWVWILHIVIFQHVWLPQMVSCFVQSQVRYFCIWKLSKGVNLPQQDTIWPLKSFIT